MKVFLLINLDKINACDISKKVIKKLKELNMDILLDEKNKQLFNEFSFVFFDEFYRQLNKCDILIAIGGDGTILHYAKHSVEVDKPILGINAGRLGFMASLEPEHINDLECLASNKFKINKRMMLKLIHKSKNFQKEYIALNDVVVSKGTLSRLIDLDVYANDEKATEYRADGLILATPTGSTAYSLSAGGPIVEHTMECILLTPICPHSLSSRTIIFDKDKTLKVKLKNIPHSQVYITIDGVQNIDFNFEDELLISVSEKYVSLIEIKSNNFYTALSNKIL